MRAVTKEARQTPQVFHLRVSALGRDPAVILKDRGASLTCG